MLGLTPLPLLLPGPPLPDPPHDRIAHSRTAVNRLFEWPRSPLLGPEIIALQLVSLRQARVSDMQCSAKHRE